MNMGGSGNMGNMGNSMGGSGNMRNNMGMGGSGNMGNNMGGSGNMGNNMGMGGSGNMGINMGSSGNMGGSGNFSQGGNQDLSNEINRMKGTIAQMQAQLEVLKNTGGGTGGGSGGIWLDNIVQLHSFSSQHENSKFEAKNILDRNKTYWLSETGRTTNCWFVFDFKKTVIINKISIQTDDFECSLKDFLIEQSNDNYDWKIVRDFQCQNGTINKEEQFFEGFEIRGRYVRLLAKNNWGSGGGQFLLIKNVRFFGPPN